MLDEQNEKPEEKVVFLDVKESDGRQKTPVGLIIILALTLLIILWKSAVRDPEGEDKAIQRSIQRYEVIQEDIKTSNQKHRQEALKKRMEQLRNKNETDHTGQ
ncbi:MAG: hypothetical protein H6858_01675 [Rhodospirillales bacterium]|nr:hypothetical protein [Alphaproteobacteria bacterium]MCB1839342.1 hypothetical protein [Alphaproteobacteria bacterium]MCB9976292.1 hypothetical protein [Rhodospirillales bacterium]